MRFVALLEKRTVPSIQRNFYMKWLRYYLDFCAKYRLPDSSSKNLTQFSPSCGKRNRLTSRLSRRLMPYQSILI